MNADAMKERTRTLALRVIHLVESLPNSKTADVIGKQLLRCGTSVGANYRSSTIPIFAMKSARDLALHEDL